MGENSGSQQEGSNKVTGNSALAREDQVHDTGAVTEQRLHRRPPATPVTAKMLAGGIQIAKREARVGAIQRVGVADLGMQEFHAAGSEVELAKEP